MDSKRLIIAFFAVSLAAIAASCAAVVTVGRAYSRMLAREPVEPPSVGVSDTADPLPAPETGTAPDVTETEADLTVFVPERTEPEESEESTPGEETEAPVAFSLVLSGDRLVILSPEGESVYERITDVRRLHPKDLESLAAGLFFATREEAMRAVYDLVS